MWTPRSELKSLGIHKPIALVLYFSSKMGELHILTRLDWALKTGGNHGNEVKGHKKKHVTTKTAVQQRPNDTAWHSSDVWNFTEFTRRIFILH